MPVKKITPAKLHWDDQGLPRSVQFDDVYFSAENGLEESRYVFLKGNDLSTRWKKLDEAASFVICETGFGSGLNLLAAAELWEQVAPESARLHFISTELYPLRVEDLKRALALWPQLSELAVNLIEQYPALTPGFHRFELTASISVTLIFDEVIDGLYSLCPTLAPEMWGYKNWHVDAWFLDGFAPAKNPELWQQKIFGLMHRLSADNATAATFTCAGAVKRGLQEWGFDIEKVPGFGRKREMLVAGRNTTLQINLDSIASTYRSGYRSASPCWHLDEHQIKKPKSVAIIGAGIAGCTLAEALSRRGIESTIFDSGHIANGASGFPQAGLYARLSPDQGDLEDFCLDALNYSRGFYKKQAELNHSPDAINLCGLIQLPKSDNEHRKMQLIAERFSDASAFVSFKKAAELEVLSGKSLDSDGLWFPNCGWVNGPVVCQSLIEQSSAILREKTCVADVIERDNGVQLLGQEDENLGEFDAVVICTATQSPPIKSANWLPVRSIRGQISFLKSPAELEGLKAVVCKKTSVTPANAEMRYSVGATYDIDNSGSNLTLQEHQTNLDQLQDLLNLEQPLIENHQGLSGRAATRATTPDYLPLVGSLPNFESVLQRFSLWSKDRKRPIPQPSENHKGIYLNLGYGSRGYSYAPLCAELLAANISREPSATGTEMQASLHPARFILRSLIKNRPLKP